MSVRTALDSQQVVIDGTKFTISKLGAMDGYRLMMDIRKALGEVVEPRDLARNISPSTSLDDPDAAVSILAAIAPIILKLDTQFIFDAQDRMWERVTFVNAQAKTPQRLAGAEDMAFAESGPDAPFEMLVRCLAVNFGGSILKIASVFGL